jgi:signal peptidase I
LFASVGGLITPAIVLLLIDGATRRRPLTPSHAWHPAAIVLAAAVSCWTVKRCLRATWRQGALAWLPGITPALVMAALVIFVIWPHALDWYSDPGSGMAPTLLGFHRTGNCPRCGGQSLIALTAYEGGNPPSTVASPTAAFRAFARRRVRGAMDQDIGICENCLAAVQQSPLSHQLENPDRFVVNKLLTPKRWDVVLFRLPGDPTKLQALRIVGLPGETIVIRDGAVWVDGVGLDPPGDLVRLEYSTLNSAGLATWGTPADPAVLGDDEFFVLGDFTAVADDSRTWLQGAPGRRAYALPRGYIVGVVTHIYWPPTRWRVLR